MSHQPEQSSEKGKQSESRDSLLYSIVILDGSQRLSLLDSLKALPLSVRARNALMRGGIRTVDALLGASEYEIRKLRNVGQKTLGEVRAVKERLQISSEQPVFTGASAATSREKGEPVLATAEAQSRTASFYRNHLLVVELRKTNQALSAVIADDTVTKQLNDADIHTTGDLLNTRLHQCIKIEGISIESWKEILKNSKFGGAIRCQPLPIQGSPPYEVEQLGLSVRTAYHLLNVGITDLQQIARLTFADVLSINRFGSRALGELLATLGDKLDGIDVEPCVEEDNLAGFTSVLQNSTIDKLVSFGIKEPEDLGQYTFEDLILKAKLTYHQAQQVISGLSVIGASLSTRWPRQSLVSQGDYQYLKRMQIPLDRISISRLALPIPLEEGLRSLGVATVDVAACQSKTVLNLALGARTIELVDTLANSLREYFAWLPTQGSWENEVANKGLAPLYLVRFRETELERIIETLLNHIPHDRYRKVIRLRFGLDGGGQRTLKEVGEQLGLTRERIRQVQQKATDKLKQGTADSLIRALYILIEEEMKAFGGLMTVAQSSEYIEDLMDIGEIDIDGAVSLLLSLKPDHFAEMKKNKRWRLKDVSRHHVVSVSHQLGKILQAVHAPLPQPDLVERLTQTEWYAQYGDKDKLSTKFIEACLSTDDCFERTEDNGWGLTRWRKQRTDEIVMALRKLGRPSHYTDIAKVTNEMLPAFQRTSARNILARLQYKPELFVWVGPGTYGLAEWGLKRPRFYADIADDLLEQRGEPLTFEEIFIAIDKERGASPQSIQFMLSTHPRFHQYPEDKFGLASWLEESDEEEEGEPNDPFLEDLKRRVFDDFSNANSQQDTA